MVEKYNSLSEVKSVKCEKHDSYVPEEDRTVGEKFSDYVDRSLWRIFSEENTQHIRKPGVTIRDKRLVIDSTYSKLLIDSAAQKIGGYSALASILQVSRKTLKNYRDGRATIPRKIYISLSQITGLKIPIKDERSPTWGQSKGWRVAVIKIREIRRNKELLELANVLLRQKPEQLAELVGRMLGDGSITMKNPCYYSSNLRDHERMVELVNSLFGFKPKIKARKNYYRTNLRTCITRVLNIIGIPSGKKSITNPHFPSFIFESVSTIKAALRSFISDEGYLVGNFMYIDISVRIPEHKLSAVTKINMIGKEDKYILNIVKDVRSNLLDDVSKMLTKLSVPHELYPQKIVKNKNSISIVWRIKIEKERLTQEGIISNDT